MFALIFRITNALIRTIMYVTQFKINFARMLEIFNAIAFLMLINYAKTQLLEIVYH
jgi:hypothetical protein